MAGQELYVEAINKICDNLRIPYSDEIHAALVKEWAFPTLQQFARATGNVELVGSQYRGMERQLSRNPHIAEQDIPLELQNQFTVRGIIIHDTEKFDDLITTFRGIARYKTPTAEELVSFLKTYAEPLLSVDPRSIEGVKQLRRAGAEHIPNLFATQEESFKQEAARIYKELHDHVKSMSPSANRPLIIVGEFHSSPSSAMVEQMLLQIAEEHGINHLILECSKEELEDMREYQARAIHAPAAFGTVHGNQHILMAQLLTTADTLGVTVVPGDVPDERKYGEEGATHIDPNKIKPGSDEAAKVRQIVFTEREDSFVQHLPKGQPALMFIGDAHMFGVYNRTKGSHHPILIHAASLHLGGTPPLPTPDLKNTKEFAEEINFPRDPNHCLNLETRFNFDDVSPKEIDECVQYAVQQHAIAREAQIETQGQPANAHPAMSADSAPATAPSTDQDTPLSRIVRCLTICFRRETPPSEPTESTPINTQPARYDGRD